MKVLVIMRYAKDTVVVQAERDIPLLRQVCNSKFVSHISLFELMRFGRMGELPRQFQLARSPASQVQIPFGLRRNL